ncbi:hypothetical protein ACRS52_21030 [Bacillus cytotoxicus]|uniref:hypothetical protein n=1 Tax=Bacillus cereus group TaxID=86661 RepID=UPI000B34F56B|nr:MULTISPECIES: hypothetical protein [Bacillus cereus group]MDH2882626.1 hypothetical protein [Bacillus cytotoxicus]MDH2890339.1 hypothetical protein [Bacillus cytotoxicus]
MNTWNEHESNEPYKLVSFNVVVVTIYKRCHTVTIKLTNLCYLKIHELKALDCRLKAMSAFYFNITT